MGSGLFAESSFEFRSTFHAEGQILEQARQQIRSIYGPVNLTAVGLANLHTPLGSRFLERQTCAVYVYCTGESPFDDNAYYNEALHSIHAGVYAAYNLPVEPPSLATAT